MQGLAEPEAGRAVVVVVVVAAAAAAGAQPAAVRAAAAAVAAVRAVAPGRWRPFESAGSAVETTLVGVVVAASVR